MRSRILALAGLTIALGLLVPGLTLPVITIEGVLQPAGIAELAPTLIERGVSEQSVATLRPLLNPAVLGMLDSQPGGLRGVIVHRIGAQLSKELASGSELEVYHQTRSILGSVRYLYRAGSNTAATLILVFSVLVPFLKMLLVLWALFHRDDRRRERTLRFVETIAKWSMADVFAVALFIAYLAAQATQSAGVSASAIVTFRATLGPGFYWFAAYCLVSLATQQATARGFRATP